VWLAPLCEAIDAEDFNARDHWFDVEHARALGDLEEGAALASHMVKDDQRYRRVLRAIEHALDSQLELSGDEVTTIAGRSLIGWTGATV
jgi:hypothetical protein